MTGNFDATMYAVEYSHVTEKWVLAINTQWPCSLEAEEMQWVCNSDATVRLFSRKQDAQAAGEAAIRRQEVRNWRAEIGPMRNYAQLRDAQLTRS